MALSPGTADLTLTATNQAILTAPAALVISKATACNTDSASHTVTIYKVPGAGTAGPGNIVVDGSGASAFTVAPGATAALPLSGLVLGQADSLQGFASLTAVVNISVGYLIPS